MSRSTTIPKNVPSLLTLFSYLTLLHVLYLVWRERTEARADAD